MDSVAVLGVMIPMVAIICVLIMVVYLRRYENEERMAMIEKGVSLEFFSPKRTSPTSWPLRVSLLLIGGGIGLLLGHFLDRSFDMDEIGYFSMLFIFGGLGLGISYIIEERKIKEEKKSS